MPKSVYFARIAITLPPEDLETADRLAAEQDRSRSWIVAEAIRQYAANGSGRAAAKSTGNRRRSRTAEKSANAAIDATMVESIDEAEALSGDGSGLGASRMAQLVRDMRLTPEQRVRLAEESLRLTELVGTAAITPLRTFDRYEDFLDWKQSRGSAS